ncbi:MAG: hypothetical protein NTV62_02405 [Candidatus Gribaldobacteria bacterium]|nr:hypothetical protein [Candidatus Gribaldobacteria bacterium]
MKTNIEAIKKMYLEGVEKNTPDEIKQNPVFDLSKKDEIEIELNKEIIEKLKLEDWALGYKKEAAISTAGIRGAQNILYPWDRRFPFNYMGVVLATLAKCLVLKEEKPGQVLNKIVAGEVRYNTKEYIEIISRVEAGLGIKVHLPKNDRPMPIWLVSFLLFMNDFDGGEYVTASHAVSSKTATKDLDGEGSQFLPEKATAFADKIEEIIKTGKEKGFLIKLSAKKSDLIVENLDGITEYVEYLKKGVLDESSIDLIKEQIKQGLKITFDFGGGCMHSVMEGILEKIGVEQAFEYLREKSDPFYYGIGKILRENKNTGQEEFFDLSCDASILAVVATMDFKDLLKKKSLGHIVFSVDPDGDRIVLMQIESKSNSNKLSNLGISFVDLDEERILVVYQPNYGFLMLFDYYAKQLKQAGKFEKHNRFIIKTTVTSKAWDEWAKNNQVKVINTPVGFKEIANVMKKVEKQIKADEKADIIIKDIFGKDINLGKLPRMLAGGEESGGMIIGPEEYIKSQAGRVAISMREKSAGESAVLATVLVAYLFKNKIILSDYLESILEENKIENRYYVRGDKTYYNESEPNPEALKQQKKIGEKQRDKVYSFYLALVMAKNQKIITFEQAKIILQQVFPTLDFNDLKDIIFVGDGIYFDFVDMFVEIRKSGTDAKARIYVCSQDKQRYNDTAHKFEEYEGDLPQIFQKLISQEFIDRSQALADEIYTQYFRQGL